MWLNCRSDEGVVGVSESEAESSVDDDVVGDDSDGFMSAWGSGDLGICVGSSGIESFGCDVEVSGIRW